jgi:hypothetical protein
MTTISLGDLAALLLETGAAHHHAYVTTDGVDPEWASWYAPYLQARLGDRLGRSVTRSGLVYLLVKAQRQQAAEADTSPWPEYYASVLLEG